MQKSLTLIFLSFMLFKSSLFAENFYCTTDAGFISYASGVTTDLNSTASYASLANCQSNCKTYKTCDTKTLTKHLAPITGSTKLSEIDKVSFEALLAPEKLSSILITSNGNFGAFDFGASPLDGLAFIFPTMPTDILNPIATNTVWSGGGNSISLKAAMEVTSYQATCVAGDTLQGIQCYHIDSTYAIPGSGNCSVGDYKTTVCERRTYYTPNKCTAGDTLSDLTCYHKTGNSFYQIGATYNGVTLDMANTATYIDPLTEQTFNSAFYFSTEASYSGFTCKVKSLRGQIQAGNLGNNFFSDKSTCESYCTYQNDCTTVPLVSTGCTVTDSKFSNPVTDYTGKTVFTQAHQSSICQTKTLEQTGCDEYKISNAYNDVKYDTSAIGWRYSKYSGLEEAATSALMTEQMQHIFSGWKGKCENGMMFNNPFNDPMKILSYAIMVYGAAGSDALKGTPIESIKNSVTESFDTASQSMSDGLSKVKEAFSGGAETYADGWTSGLSTNGAAIDMTYPDGWTSAINNPETFLDKAQRLNTAWTGSLGGIDLTLKYSAIAEAAISLAFPPKEDYIPADKLMKSWMGANEQDLASLAYVQCMSSIGLSFPNLASWSASDVNGMSPELKSPITNPLRLTDYQVSILIAATSPNFVKIGLMPIEANADSMTYLALSPLVYQQVGQVICGGKLAVAHNILTEQTTPPPSLKSDANVGIITAKLAVSTFPPPANLMASLILDIATSFESGNACTDQEIAVKWGVDQFKTNQHLNFGQCHYVSTSCAAKWFWGKCMRKRNTYCCYDQIVTRVMMEGIKPQLGKDWSSCNDISINDLKNISFQPCLPSQSPFLDKCFPADKFEEFQLEMKKQASKGLATQSMKDVVNQAVNSMAIPGKNLQETCKDCNK